MRCSVCLAQFDPTRSQRNRQRRGFKRFVCSPQCKRLAQRSSSIRTATIKRLAKHLQQLPS